MDIRVQDYLDDKFQSSADLETLDSLLQTVKTQQGLLKQQLQDAKRDHSDAQQAAEQHASMVEEQARAFQKEQAEIDRSLMIVTQSETSDEASQKFEASMDRLRKLDVAVGYTELLKEVQGLSDECISQLGKSDEAALEPYRRLQRLVTSLQPLQEAAEGAAPHLLDHIAQSAQMLRSRIELSFAADFEKTLKKMHWPKASTTVPLALQNEWTVNIGRLLDLQRPELEMKEQTSGASSSTAEEPPALLPLQVMVQPLEQRFNYHFSGDKATNRLDKPEYFLSHVTDLLSTYVDFIQGSLQILLVTRFRGSDLALKPAYIDGTSALITALLPMLRRKLSTVADQVASQPPLLSHLIHEVMAFDTTLRDTYAYTPTSPSTEWRGLAYFLLDSCGYFQQWLSVEQNFALSRYRAIIDSPESGELDYDSVSESATKPTKSAIRVNDLLETITDRYRPLSSFSQKLRFLIDIQISIFDEFHRRLHGSLEAYLTRTSAIARTVHGVTREEQTELQGVKGLDHLCRVFGSAEYLENAMRDWSDDVFFLELWEELQLRAKNSNRISRNLGELHEIQQKTSTAIIEADGEGEVQGALFDETAGAYHRLRVRSEGIIVDTISYGIRESLRPYSRINPWATLSSSTAGGSTSAELDPVLRLLSEYLGFLSKALGKAPLRRTTRNCCQVIQSFLWENVLLRHSFSTAGASQFAVDFAAVCVTIDDYVGPGQARSGMRRISEAIELLSLPVRSEISRVGKSLDGDDDDGTSAWDDDEDEVEVQEKKLGLWEVERQIFMDNQSARHVLDQMGLEVLSEADARSVLEKRVELAS